MKDGSPYLLSVCCAKAYAEGRKASVAEANINTNPHVTGTPEALAWNRGHRLYASGGTTTTPDNCPEPAKYTAPTVTATRDVADGSGLTYDMSVGNALPIEYHWDDGTQTTFSETGAAKHTFAYAGVFTVKAMILGEQASTVSVTVVVTEISVSPTLTVSTATDSVTVTYTEDGLPVEGKTVTPESSDTGCFTVGSADDTDGDGEVTFIVTSVEDGEGVLTVTADDGPVGVCAVTVSAHPDVTVPATFALSAASDTVTASYTESLVAHEGETLTPASSDAGKFTVSAADETDASGEVVFTMTRVADGEATLTVTSATGAVDTCVVTVSGS